MIDWAETKMVFGRGDLSGPKPQVVVKCDACNITRIIKIFAKNKVINNQLPWLCRSCDLKQRWKDNSYKNIMIDGIKEGHKNKEYIKPSIFDTPEYKQKMSEYGKKAWSDPTVRKFISNNTKLSWKKGKLKGPDRSKVSAAVREKWNDPDFRQRMCNNDEVNKRRSIITKKLWSTPKYRLKLKAIMNSEKYRANSAKILASLPKVSSVAEILYSILNDLDIKYFREWNDKPDDKECQIANYHFDCVIPRDGKRTLLIDVNGDWIHSRPKVISKDQSKATYITNNLSDVYEYKILWEHEFKCKDKIIELIKYWMGITHLELIDFEFSNVVIRKCEAKDYRILLSKYHYLPTAGRGGIVYGAYLGSVLIAVCVFSNLVRHNIDTMTYKPEECRELSRLCIHPKYQKKNFASWFVSRCINLLDESYKMVISYCDTTHNHNGAVYKACNFVLDREVPPDYWYVKEDGWVMHKKTLYNHAINCHMKESEFAEKHGYNKVYGGKKLRFIYER